ncbi:MAG TPA: replication-relaxation family protein [Terriglobia bacterium]|nr:replication-relaxation family protein [Terriglobia bacterium]
MRLTERDRKFLTRLAAARWLSTRQVAAWCFPSVNIEVARRRLRLLEDDEYIFTHQRNAMDEALHSLAKKGRDLLKEKGWEYPLRLEKAPPTNLAHFLGINDIRIAVTEGTARDGVAIGFFFACWELQQRGWPYRLIPDAACNLSRSQSSVNVVFEYDRGEESIAYLRRTKLLPYLEGFGGFVIRRVVFVVENDERSEELKEVLSNLDEERMFAVLMRTRLDASFSPIDYFA